MLTKITAFAAIGVFAFIAIGIIAVGALNPLPQTPAEAHSVSNENAVPPSCFQVHPTNASPTDVPTPILHATWHTLPASADANAQDQTDYTINLGWGCLSLHPELVCAVTVAGAAPAGLESPIRIADFDALSETADANAADKADYQPATAAQCPSLFHTGSRTPGTSYSRAVLLDSHTFGGACSMDGVRWVGDDNLRVYVLDITTGGYRTIRMALPSECGTALDPNADPT